MLKLWRILNSIGNFVYFVGAIFGFIFLALILTVFMPPIISWTFAALIVVGVVLGVYGNVKNDRERRADEELQDMASGRHRPKRL